MNYNEALNIFSLSSSFSMEELKIAYRKEAKKYHPDVNKDKIALAKMQRINMAFDLLNNKAIINNDNSLDESKNNIINFFSKNIFLFGQDSIYNEIIRKYIIKVQIMMIRLVPDINNAKDNESLNNKESYYNRLLKDIINSLINELFKTKNYHFIPENALKSALFECNKANSLKDAYNEFIQKITSLDNIETAYQKALKMEIAKEVSLSFKNLNISLKNKHILEFSKDIFSNCYQMLLNNENYLIILNNLYLELQKIVFKEEEYQMLLSKLFMKYAKKDNKLIDMWFMITSIFDNIADGLYLTKEEYEELNNLSFNGSKEEIDLVINIYTRIINKKTNNFQNIKPKNK